MPEVMTLASFISYVECGAFTDDDGHGCYGESAHNSTNSKVSPSDIENNEIDRSYTHVFWYAN